MNGGGRNYYLDRNTFVDLVNDMEAHKRIDVDKATPIAGDNELKLLYFSAFGTKYENSVGTEEFYLLNNLVEGYSDLWKFDKKSDGQRSSWAEFKTWVGNAVPGTPFMVLYGVTPTVDQMPRN